MTSYVSILSCLSGGQEESSKNDCDKVHNNSDINLSDGDQKEITEIFEDLMTIQNKDVLRRNLVTLVTENITLKKQKKQLQTDLETRKEAANYSFQIDCDGAEDEVETGEKIRCSKTAQMRWKRWSPDLPHRLVCNLRQPKLSHKLTRV